MLLRIALINFWPSLTLACIVDAVGELAMVDYIGMTDTTGRSCM
jgi:hypothetical protein